MFPFARLWRTLPRIAGPDRGGKGTPVTGVPLMDQYWGVALVLAAVAAIFGLLSILRRIRMPAESPFAASTEGEKRCPNCGMGNQWTDARCISCGADLPG
jgi:hypothetical protein